MHKICIENKATRKEGWADSPGKAVRPRKVMEKDIDYVRLGNCLGYAGRMWQE